MRHVGLCVVLVLGGCEHHDCTLMYAPSSLTVDVGDSDLSADSYTFAFAGSAGEALTCTITPATDPGTFATACVDGAGLAQSGMFGATTLIVDAWAPDEFDLTVSDPDGALFTGHFAPDWAEDEPNGEGCGVRRQGSVDVVW